MIATHWIKENTLEKIKISEYKVKSKLIYYYAKHPTRLSKESKLEEM